MSKQGCLVVDKLQIEAEALNDEKQRADVRKHDFFCIRLYSFSNFCLYSLRLPKEGWLNCIAGHKPRWFTDA